VGGLRFAKKIRRYQTSEGNVLRQRCDARGFKRPTIEIIATRKAASAFESQILSQMDELAQATSESSRDEGLAKIGQKGARDWVPGRACKVLFGNLAPTTLSCLA
jgi:hypothetical protein